jgi:hypothetical protein
MAIMREVPRIRTVDHQEIAVAVLGLIRHEGLDVVHDVPEIDEWIDELIARAGLDATCLDKGRVRECLKAQPGVDYRHVRIKSKDIYRALRARLQRRRGFVPEKVWVFHVQHGLVGVAPPPIARRETDSDRAQTDHAWPAAPPGSPPVRADDPAAPGERRTRRAPPRPPDRNRPEPAADSPPRLHRAA